MGKYTNLGEYLFDLTQKGKEAPASEWELWIRMFGLEKVEKIIMEAKEKRDKQLEFKVKSHASLSLKDD